MFCNFKFAFSILGMNGEYSKETHAQLKMRHRWNRRQCNDTSTMVELRHVIIGPISKRLPNSCSAQNQFCIKYHMKAFISLLWVHIASSWNIFLCALCKMCFCLIYFWMNRRKKTLHDLSCLSIASLLVKRDIYVRKSKFDIFISNSVPKGASWNVLFAVYLYVRPTFVQCRVCFEEICFAQWWGWFSLCSAFSLPVLFMTASVQWIWLEGFTADRKKAKPL